MYSTYNALLESGWRMDDIDRMDILGFLRIRAWSSQKEKRKNEPKQAHIDQVWPGLRP